MIFVGHECATAQQRGWGGAKNGELLRLAEGEYDLFITADQNLRYQQNISGRRIIRILELSTNDLRRIRGASEEIRSAVASMAPGDFLRLDIP